MKQKKMMKVHFNLFAKFSLQFLIELCCLRAKNKGFFIIWSIESPKKDSFVFGILKENKQMIMKINKL